MFDAPQHTAPPPDSPPDSPSDKPEDRIGKVLHRGAFLFAMAGGFIMTGLIVMTVLSVLGRWLFNAPIYGDFEMVAMGTAVAVFLFLPYCQMRRGNVIVDLFLSWAPRGVQAAFDVAGALMFGGLSALFAWRMTLGGMNAVDYNETTYILALPLWWAYPFAVASFAMLALTCLYTAYHEAKRLLA